MKCSKHLVHVLLIMAFVSISENNTYPRKLSSNRIERQNSGLITFCRNNILFFGSCKYLNAVNGKYRWMFCETFKKKKHHILKIYIAYERYCTNSCDLQYFFEQVPSPKSFLVVWYHPINLFQWGGGRISYVIKVVNYL